MRLSGKWIIEAVRLIKGGICTKLEIDGVTVYRCGKIIRIDIKDDEEVEYDTCST